jgi:hypothetical protein
VRSTLADDFHTFIPSKARPHPPSLILFSLGLMTRVLFATLFLTIAAAHAEPHYTEQMFRRGLHEPGVLITTAPLFVLITLRDPSNGAERAAAMPGPFLLGAIETEYRLKLRKTTSHDDIYKALAEKQQKEVQIALAQPNRVFVFRNRKARNNVQPRYTPAMLTEVRSALTGRSWKEIFAAARANESWLHQIYDGRRDPVQRLAYRDAVAHVLLERGSRRAWRLYQRTLCCGQKDLTMRWSERRTAVRSTFEMTSTLPLRATRALVRRRSSYSR